MNRVRTNASVIRSQADGFKEPTGTNLVEREAVARSRPLSMSSDGKH